MAADAGRVIGRDELARAFEHAPGLVARLTEGIPFPSADAVVARARTVIAAMKEPERATLLASHPRIGEDPGSLSPASRREQGADIDPAVLRQLAKLNDAYERRFGFRFVVFVAGRPKAEILGVLGERMERPREAELATGLEELLAIARDRLSPA